MRFSVYQNNLWQQAVLHSCLAPVNALFNGIASFKGVGIDDANI
jgi:hypothetical protein